MRQSTKRFASLIFSLLLLIGVGIVYFNFIVPAYNDLQSLRQDEASRSQFVDNEKAAVQKVQDLISTYQGQTGLQDTVSQALPLSPDISGALLQLDGIAQITGVLIQQYSVTQTLNNPASPDQSSGADTSQSPLSGLASPMGTLVFRIQLSGSYENLKNFIKDVETNIRIFNVQSIAVHPSSQAVGKSAADNFSYDVAVAAYYQSQPANQ